MQGEGGRIDRRSGEPPDVSHLFASPFVLTYEWTATHDTVSYLDMLGTQSPCLALGADRRSRLFEGIATLIEDRLGGA